MFDLLIRGGEVVTPQGVGKWSVGVQGEKIVFIGTEEHAPQAGRTVDAAARSWSREESNLTPISISTISPILTPA